jgi:hypothetical protein
VSSSISRIDNFGRASEHFGKVSVNFELQAVKGLRRKVWLLCDGPTTLTFSSRGGFRSRICFTVGLVGRNVPIDLRLAIVWSLGAEVCDGDCAVSWFEVTN